MVTDKTEDKAATPERHDYIADPGNSEGCIKFLGTTEDRKALRVCGQPRDAAVHAGEAQERGRLEEAIKRHRDYYEGLAESGSLSPEDGAQLRHVLAQVPASPAQAPAADATQFLTRSFTFLENAGHSVRLINRESKGAISIPWDELPALAALINLTLGCSTTTTDAARRVAEKIVQRLLFAARPFNFATKDVWADELAAIIAAELPTGTVEGCLAELRTMFPDETTIEVRADANARYWADYPHNPEYSYAYALVSIGEKQFRADTLAEAMEAVRAAAKGAGNDK